MEKKNRTGLAAAIVIAVLVVIAAGTAVFFMGRAFGSKPELRIAAGMKKMTEEMGQYGSSLSEQIDFGTINELRKTGTLHTDTDVSITVTDGETTNVEFSVDALTNVSQKKASCDIGIGMYGFQIPFADVAATQDMLYISLPELVKDTYRVDLTTLGEKFNNSEWARMLDTELPENYSIALFQEDDGKRESAAEELAAIISKPGEALKENAVLENIRDKKEGRSGVRMTVEKEVVNQYMEEFRDDLLASEFYQLYIDRLMSKAGDLEEGMRLKAMSDALLEDAMSMRLETDYVLDFYFDKQGRIVNISSPADMKTIDGDLLAVDIQFKGEERVLDVIEGGVYLKSGDEIEYLGIERNANVSETQYHESVKLILQSSDHAADLVYSYENDFNKEDMSFDLELYADLSDGKIRFTADGEFTDIVKGESYTLRVNNSSLELDDEELCYLSMVLELEPADEEPEIPDNYVDLLDMSAQEIQGMVYEALISIRKFNYE